jgi:hypothetical protein
MPLPPVPPSAPDAFTAAGYWHAPPHDHDRWDHRCRFGSIGTNRYRPPRRDGRAALHLVYPWKFNEVCGLRPATAYLRSDHLVTYQPHPSLIAPWVATRTETEGQRGTVQSGRRPPDRPSTYRALLDGLQPARFARSTSVRQTGRAVPMHAKRGRETGEGRAYHRVPYPTWPTRLQLSPARGLRHASGSTTRPPSVLGVPTFSSWVAGLAWWTLKASTTFRPNNYQ